MLRAFFLMAALGLPFAFAEAQEDYRTIFSDDYKRANQFLIDEAKWMDKITLSHLLKPKEVKAIVFPELIRYSSIQDKIETFALESLYIQFGKQYANFSIGCFQIKPSFAENIEIDFVNMFGELELRKNLKIDASDTCATTASRSARLKRIKDKQTQLTYVCLFFKIMQHKYPRWETAREKVMFFASAYNSGYRKSEAETNGSISKRFFHTGFVAVKKYSYSAVAEYYFQN